MRSDGFHWPDFFIIGAPKSGTTAIASYLADHPDVCLSRPKEPHFFLTDLPMTRYSREADSVERYIACFEHANEGELFGEASVFYLFSRDAVAKILALRPDARLLVFIRNPVDLAVSLHQQFVRTEWEDLPFEEAWDRALRGAPRERLPPRCPSERWLDYPKVVSLGRQVERTLRLAERRRVHFFLFDDLRGNAAGVYAEVLDVLGLAHDGRSEFPVVNPAQSLRWTWLRRGFDRARRVKLALGIERDYGTTKLVRRWNLKRTNPHARVSEATKEAMRDVLRDDVNLLQTLIDRPLGRLWGFETR